MKMIIFIVLSCALFLMISFSRDFLSLGRYVTKNIWLLKAYISKILSVSKVQLVSDFTVLL